MSKRKKHDVEKLLQAQSAHVGPVTFIAHIDTETRGIISIRVVGESGYQVLSTILEQGIMTQDPTGKYLGIPAKAIRSIEMVAEPTVEDVKAFPPPTEEVKEDA